MTEKQTRRIEALYGPLRGLIDVPADVAEQAIKDGWARDPFAPPPSPDDPPPEPLTQEKRDAMLVSAEKAARKLRGELEPDEKAKAKNESRQATAQTDQGATYKTRAPSPPHKDDKTTKE